MHTIGYNRILYIYILLCIYPSEIQFMSILNDRGIFVRSTKWHDAAGYAVDPGREVELRLSTLSDF